MNNGSDQCISIIVSIGTGKNNSSRFGGTGLSRYLNYENFVRKWASDSEKAHEDMLKNLEKSPFKFDYYRLNVEHGLSLMKLDEWRYRGQSRLKIGRCVAKLRRRPRAGNSEEDMSEKTATDSMDDSMLAHTPRVPKYFQPKNNTLESIRTHTSAYLEQLVVRKWIDKCAEILVKRRRERAKKDPPRWEKACFRAWYQCVVRNCPRGEKEYGSRAELLSHLEDKHGSQLEKPIEEVLDACKIIVH